jgi:hypothetical protein
MKTILTIVLMLVAMMAVKTSNANSQEACSQGYVGCVDSCLKKPGGQDQCIALCQQRNDQCASKVYGTPTPVAEGGAQPKESGEAMDARDDGTAAEPAEKPAKARTKAPASATAKAPQKSKQEAR